ncbi:lipoyl(octanoyl) transferase LipB [Arcanobacterium ihumii]|uniref:lipoyl(octanoyl) transferase LipB n=1 Tax=Arcanobacterium ihumii TaxID=2138162 RepID=UPI000F53753B|nr:lipoyl(octanoyl) transferase LipB [Arcanobacterium ihumii]
MHILNLLGYGALDYMVIDQIQRRLHAEVATLQAPDTLLIWEAKDVYTAGRRTQPEDIPDTNVPVITMDRGGSVTYHGPGQLVIYPIVKVKPPKDVVAFVRNTETAIIDAMRTYEITAAQVEGRSGVWILKEDELDRKLCAIGIKFADDATLHGMALNVHTDVDRFMRIIPCGLKDAGVVTLKQLGVNVSLQDVADTMIPHLTKAYEQFLLRPDSLHEYSKEATEAYIREAHNSLDNAKLPPKTGVAWKANMTKGPSARAIGQ